MAEEIDTIAVILIEMKKLRSEMTLIRIELQNQGKVIEEIRSQCRSRLIECNNRQSECEDSALFLTVVDEVK